jgi:hypothetical protein
MANFIQRLFWQKRAVLVNGEVVKEGDCVSFVNSDGEICTDVIRRREDGTLYFWNITHNIDCYRSAHKTKNSNQ